MYSESDLDIRIVDLVLHGFTSFDAKELLEDLWTPSNGGFVEHESVMSDVRVVEVKWKLSESRTNLGLQFSIFEEGQTASTWHQPKLDPNSAALPQIIFIVWVSHFLLSCHQHHKNALSHST